MVNTIKVVIKPIFSIFITNFIILGSLLWEIIFVMLLKQTTFDNDNDSQWLWWYISFYQQTHYISWI
jgi:hypothetical protein